jgi:hypothetical protein
MDLRYFTSGHGLMSLGINTIALSLLYALYLNVDDPALGSISFLLWGLLTGVYYIRRSSRRKEARILRSIIYSEYGITYPISELLGNKDEDIEEEEVKALMLPAETNNNGDYYKCCLEVGLMSLLDTKKRWY